MSTLQRLQSERHQLLVLATKKEEQPQLKKSMSSSASLKKRITYKWKDEFPWLTMRKENGTLALHCSVCCDAPEVAGDTQFIKRDASLTKKRPCKNMERAMVICVPREQRWHNRSLFGKQSSPKASPKLVRMHKRGTEGKWLLK